MPTSLPHTHTPHCPAVTEPIYGGQLARDYLQMKVNPVLVQGLTQLCKEKPEDTVVRAFLVHMYIHVHVDMQDFF